MRGFYPVLLVSSASFLGGRKPVAVRGQDKVWQSTTHDDRTRDATRSVPSTDIKSRGHGPRNVLSNSPRPRHRCPNRTSANTAQIMSSPLPSPLASPAPETAAVGKKSPARPKSSRAKSSATKKAATSIKRSATAKKPTLKKPVSKSASDHPSWKDIIKEAITQHREDARTGVSRSAIKKYAEEKYKLDMTSASNLHQLNLALTRGAEKETFVFPKGPSGKVKLAPKRSRASVDTKENTQPPSKKAPSTKKVTEVAKAVPVKKAATGKTRTPGDKSASTKKSAVVPKKAPVTTKKAATVKKPSTKKTTSAKNDAKKVGHSCMTCMGPVLIVSNRLL
ncbi:hypothetical protein BJV74DRAFT_764723 [Russula compacta]|nr:hypothetical protein BJV74DRAFT_764723 [Russula compacta]